MLPENKSIETGITHALDVSRSHIPIYTGHLKLGGKNPRGETIELTNYYLLRNGKPCIPSMGEFHFSRYPHQFWEEELLKIKAGGVEIIATYVFWIHVEEEEGHFVWSANNDLRKFVILCAKHHLEVVVRIGPFAHGECRNGGLPDWLYGRPFEVRSNDQRYLAYVQRLYQEIAAQIEGLLYKEGGPIIGIQLDNEYMHAGAPWEVTFRQGTAWVPAGAEGVAHMKILKQLAQNVGLDVPLYTSTAWLNSPVIANEVLPMQGGYAFTPWSPDPTYRQTPTREFLFRNRHLSPVLNGAPTYDAIQYPLACCEIGGGIQDTYYHRNIIPPESIESLAVMNLAGGANLIGYYMYHGGSHPVGNHSYMNEFTVPRVSYDFQAPLREFGQVAESYRYLRLLHLFLKDFGELLAPMAVTLPEDANEITPENTTALRYAARSKDGAGFLFLNNYQDHVETQDLNNIRLSIQTSKEIISLPHNTPLTLGKNVTAILPFGLDLDGIRLQYATTQLLTKFQDGETVNYFFFAPEKMLSEYMFNPTSYQDLSVINGTVLESDHGTVITVTPGLDCRIILKSISGQVLQIFTLTRSQAERASKLTIWQKERLLITDGTIVATDEEYYLYSTGQNDVNLSIYPALEGEINTSVGPFVTTTEGGFTHGTLKLPEQSIPFTVEMMETDRARLTFSPEILNVVNNVYLRIDYIGDIGNAFIDGKLINDNFYNGTAWEIGLNHFAEQLRDNEMFILINPIRSDSSLVRYIPTGMAFKQAESPNDLAVIRSIDLVPEFKIVLDRSARSS